MLYFQATVAGLDVDTDETTCFKVEIPPAQGNMFISSIRANAFRNEVVTEVKVPRCLSEIGESAFKGSNLARMYVNEVEGDIPYFNVMLPLFVERVGNFAFADCLNIESIWFPETLKSLGAGVLLNCKNLKKVGLHGEYRILPPHALSGTGIEVVYVPKSVEQVEHHAFANCVNLKEVFMDDVKELHGYVFDGCTELEVIHVSDKLMVVGNGCFDGCKNIKKVIYDGKKAKCQIAWADLISSDYDFVVEFSEI